MNRLAIILIVALSGCSHHADRRQMTFSQSGTTIAEFISKDTIWIAADSKQVNEGAVVGIATTCKIRHTNFRFVSISGRPVLAIHGDTIFDAYKIALAQLASDSPISHVYHILTDIYQIQLQLAWRSIMRRMKDSDAYAMFKKSNILLHVMLSGFTLKGNSYHANWLYWIRFNRNNWRIDTQSLNNIDGDVYHFSRLGEISIAGHKDSIMRYLSRPNMLFSNRRSIKADLQFLIRLEIANDSSEVGPPINVVAIYKDGHRWLTDNTLCR